MYAHTRHTTAGFTLIEVLVYLAVTILVSGATVVTFLSLNTTIIRHQTEQALSHAANVTLERMTRDIRAATAINDAGSTFGSSPGSLTVTAPGTTTLFSVVSGDIMLTVNGTDVGPLTGDAVEVEALTFTRYTGTSTELVRIELTLHAESKAASTTRTFYGAAVLRGTYE